MLPHHYPSVTEVASAGCGGCRRLGFRDVLRPPSRVPSSPGGFRATTDNEDNMFIETKRTRNMGRRWSTTTPLTTASTGVGQRLSKFRNDRGVPEIRIGVSEFKCIGISPPQDHPHVYINMG